MKKLLPVCMLACFCIPATASHAHVAVVESCLVEAEAFADKGGWVVDPQFVEQMGSPYLLAHGKGIPVADATTSVNIKPRRVRAYVRTRDWTPDWDGEKPGRFQLILGGQTFPVTLGVAPATWGWVDAGVVEVGEGPQVLALHDLTGFEGRCDAIYLCPENAAMPPSDATALAAWRAEKRGEAGAPEDVVEADFVVVGGGMAGTAAAVAAAEAGLSVALVQDRPILGGNASDEIRIKTEKKKSEYHWIVDAIKNRPANGNSMAADDAKRMDFVRSYANINLNTGWRAYGVVTNAERKIVAVDARNIETGARRRFVAPLYCDATGDGWLGYWAGAKYMLGREAKDEYDEPKRAPKVADTSTMGNSLLWTTKKQADDYIFPEVPWATKVSGSLSATKGTWQWEAGLDPAEDTINDAEMLRDRVFRAIYGCFWNAKQKSENAKLVFNWVPYIAGKRESRRIVGDYVVSEKDVTECRPFEDAIGIATWTIDLHWKNGDSGFLAETTHTRVAPWWMPYRSLCCRDVPNLFLAGRCASYTHVAFGSSRVMHAGGQQGVAVGYAASLCKKYGCLPRGIHEDSAKTAELQALMNLKQTEKGMKEYRWPKPAAADGKEAVSPDGRNRIAYSGGMVTVFRDGRTLFGPQPAALRLDRGEAEVELCARNDGVAYRFRTDMDGEIAVLDETAALVFPSPDTELWVGYNWCDNPKDPKQDKLQHGCASAYTRTTPASFVPGGRRIAYLPLTVRYPDGTAALVTETDLRDYAGWHLRRNAGETRRIDGVFGKYPVRAKERNVGDRYRRVTERHGWIVKTRGRRTFPWRVFAIADTPIGLVEQCLVRDLAAPPQGDWSWVEPGVCAWDWWSGRRLEGVPFKPGANTATYKAYIDFAAEFGLGWVLVDEGWCRKGDLSAMADGFDLDAIAAYAASRGVRVMLWTAWSALDGRQEEIFGAFAKRGVAGFKVDFMERDDAEMMRFMEKTLAVAAKHRLAVDFHGCGKPCGLETTYPNLVGVEGVRGLELMKMASSKGEDFMAHDCTVPFTRAPLGHVDYTPGAMRNLRRDEWRPDRRNPASQGTRAHQMALYTLFPVPLQMMCDSPGAYRRNRECARFIASVPTVWDETKGLCGEIGKFAAVARRSGETWHAGAITDWTAREISIPTDFLGEGEWDAEIFRDAGDSGREPAHYVHERRRVKAGERLAFRLAPGGGFAIRFGRPPRGPADKP